MFFENPVRIFIRREDDTSLVDYPNSSICCPVEGGVDIEDDTASVVGMGAPVNSDGDKFVEEVEVSFLEHSTDCDPLELCSSSHPLYSFQQPQQNRCNTTSSTSFPST